MSDEGPVQRRSGAAHVVHLLLVGVVLYVLSIGPVAALHDRGVFGDWDDTVEVVYYPLGMIHWGLPVTRPAIDSWIVLWEDLL